MNIWFMLWVFLTVFVVGIFLWSTVILLRQKRAWEVFAKRHQMAYSPNGFFRSPAMRGSLRGFMTTIFSEEQVTEEAKGRKFRTVVQMELAGGMRTQGVVTSPELRPFAAIMRLKIDVLPDLPEWNKGIVFQAGVPELLSGYLTPERVKLLNTIMSSKNIGCIFVFNETETMLRFETPDPLDDPEKVERFMTKALETARILSPSPPSAAAEQGP